MCVRKYWKGYENLRPIYKHRFQNIEWFLAYLPFKGIDQWEKKRFDSGIIR
jgi:hypothetical protein